MSYKIGYACNHICATCVRLDAQSGCMNLEFEHHQCSNNLQYRCKRNFLIVQQPSLRISNQNFYKRTICQILYIMMLFNCFLHMYLKTWGYRLLQQLLKLRRYLYNPISSLYINQLDELRMVYEGLPDFLEQVIDLPNPN